MDGHSHYLVLLGPFLLLDLRGQCDIDRVVMSRHFIASSKKLSVMAFGFPIGLGLWFSQL